MQQDYRDYMRLDNQLCFPLYAAARYVTGLYTPYLKPLGLTYTQYITFLVLWEEDGLTVSEIGSRLMLDNGTLSPMLKKMEQSGWITRMRSKEDDRVVIVSLTKKGRDLQKKAKDIPGKVGSCVHMPVKKGMQLRDLLRELLETGWLSKKEE